MVKELHVMETEGFWEIVLISSMPADRKVVGNRWVLTDKIMVP
jgi:hypothetical protein